MLLQKHPQLTPLTIQAILQESARDVGAPGPDPDAGYGALDVGAALAMADAMSEGERTITVETRQPVHADGKVVAAQGRVLLLDDAPQGDAPSEVSVPVGVPAGGALVDLKLSWSGPGSFDAELDAPDGSAYAFEPGDDGASLVLQHAVHEGTYTFVAKPTGPAGDSAYSLDGDVVVRSTRVVAAQANELSSRGSYAVTSGGFDVPESPVSRALDLVETSPQAVLSGLVVASVLVIVVGTRQRRA
jgi:hypothetical protein